MRISALSGVKECGRNEPEKIFLKKPVKTLDIRLHNVIWFPIREYNDTFALFGFMLA